MPTSPNTFVRLRMTVDTLVLGTAIVRSRLVKGIGRRGNLPQDPALAGSNGDEPAVLSQPVDCPQAFSRPDDRLECHGLPPLLEETMKLGVVASVTARSLGIADLARHVEGAGLESLFLTQNTHVPASGAALFEEEYHRSDHHLLDPFVALGAAAAVTTRIKLGTGICVALLYDPIILAMQVSTLDQLSSGRFVLGIGVGHEDTVQNHGVSPELRHRILREKVLAMKAIWAGNNPECHGEFVGFGPILTGLRPRQEPHPPS
jgi:hypothetical protein